jgi:hypothetical protein
MSDLSPACMELGHDPGLPDEPLRAYVLAAAIRTAEAMLRSHGYRDATPSLEILHVAIEDAVAADVTSWSVHRDRDTSTST